MGDAVGRIEHEQSHVGVIERPQRPDERVVLRSFAAASPAPHAGGVDELDCSVVGLDDRVDGVTGRAGQVVHDRTLLAREAVEQRRLADIRPADDRDSRDTRAGAASEPLRSGSITAAARRRKVPGSGSCLTTSSSRSPTPRPCRALTIAGSPSPRPANSQASTSRRSESTLFATTITAPAARRTSWATTCRRP